jgi:uncharacterized protein (TIGR03086 family)
MNEITDYTNSLDVVASADDVFDAVATTDGLRAWWTSRVSGSNEVGGELHFQFEGITEHIVMRVDEVTRPTRVGWTCVAHTGHPEWVGTRPTFRITPTTSGRCRLDFRHYGLAPVLDCYDQCERGWDHFLASIATYAEKGHGSPYVAGTEPIDQLSTAIGLMETAVANIGPAQWDAPTPCPEWNVRELVRHVIAGNRMFASVVAGKAPDVQSRAAPDAKLPRQFRASGDELLAAFRRPGALDRVVELPIGAVPGIAALHLRVTEVLVHSWDLAEATRTRVRFPDELAELELAFSQRKLADIPADRTPFAPPQPVADDAPAIDRLAACLGRTPPSHQS